MLWFVGLGVSGCKSMSREAAGVIDGADTVYLEQFTSPVSEADLAALREMAGGSLKLVKRWMVEDGSEILRAARTGGAALLSYGDPYMATTHAELRTRAAREGIATRTLHAPSSITAVIGECGLHFYKVGRIATVMGDAKSLSTPYNIIYKNVIEGNHTVLLLEYDQENEFFLDPALALDGLARVEQDQRRSVIHPHTFVIVASRVGSADQAIRCGMLSSLAGKDFGRPPHTVIIPGRLHFTEKDSLEALADCLDAPADNSDATPKISAQMVARYAPMVREAIEEARPHYADKKECQQILENAELYVQEAERRILEGEDEVAVLCIGYADGLADALRIAAGMDPKM